MKSVRKYVVFFDICSSTLILEDLIRSESQELWGDLLLKMEEYLQEARTGKNFIIYKFIGDGWVLLFHKNIKGTILFRFLRDICVKFDELYRKAIKPVLNSPIDCVGITFGLEKGTLNKIVMNSGNEYVGRALNVAARLQGSIKDRDKDPKGKVLMSNKAYTELKKGTKREYKVYRARRKLRNISGGENYEGKKLCLFLKP